MNKNTKLEELKFFSTNSDEPVDLSTLLKMDTAKSRNDVSYLQSSDAFPDEYGGLKFKQSGWGGLEKTIFGCTNQYYPLGKTYDDSIARAFKLIQKLIKKKMVKEPKTVKQFIDLVNILAEEL